MGRHYLDEKDNSKAELAFQTAIELDRENTEARMQLAHLYESMGESIEALILAQECRQIEASKLPPAKIQRALPRRDPKRDRKPKLHVIASKDPVQDSMFSVPPAPVKEPVNVNRRRRLLDPAAKLADETARSEHLQSQYHALRNNHEQMLHGDPEATGLWMEAARDLTNDFRGVRSFFPIEKLVRFAGYREEESRAGADMPLDDELSKLFQRLSKSPSCSLFSRLI